MTDNQKIINILNQQLDIPAYKVEYALTSGILNDAYQSLKNYGITLTDDTFNIFYELVSAKLSGTPEIEYEWSNAEYKAIMDIKKFDSNTDKCKDPPVEAIEYNTEEEYQSWLTNSYATNSYAAKRNDVPREFYPYIDIHPEDV